MKNLILQSGTLIMIGGKNFNMTKDETSNEETKPEFQKSAIVGNTILNAAELKLQNETGCKYGMRDCLYRNIHPKCFKCKEKSEYDWDYTIATV